MVEATKAKTVKRKSFYKKGRTKKPADMPRRPLSAYNLYFKAAREMIIEERTQKLWAEQAGSSNKQRFKRAKISLEELAKLVAKGWKSIEPKELERFQAMANQDLLRYKQEMDAYHRKLSQKRATATEKQEREALRSDASQASPGWSQRVQPPMLPKSSSPQQLMMVMMNSLSSPAVPPLALTRTATPPVPEQVQLVSFDNSGTPMIRQCPADLSILSHESSYTDGKFHQQQGQQHCLGSWMMPSSSTCGSHPQQDVIFQGCLFRGAETSPSTQTSIEQTDDDLSYLCGMMDEDFDKSDSLQAPSTEQDEPSIVGLLSDCFEYDAAGSSWMEPYPIETMEDLRFLTDC